MLQCKLFNAPRSKSAVQDVLNVYGKGSMLAAIFGKEFGRLFNAYVIKKMKNEFV